MTLSRYSALSPLRLSREQRIALAYGLICHGMFAVGVGAMAWALYHGLQGPFGPFKGWAASAANLLLVIQFPVLHSLLLSAPGRRALGRLAPARLRGALRTTLFATAAAAQLAVVFLLWSPIGEVLWEASGGWLWLSRILYALSWALLGKAMWDAGLGLQTGALGWWGVFRGRPSRYPDMPTQGTFKVCRQPIYLAFALVLWTGPVMSTDKLILGVSWTLYCVFGPLLKERRFEQRYGRRFRAYRQAVPYLIPRLSLALGRPPARGGPGGA